MGLFSSKQAVHDSNRTGAVKGAKARQRQAAARERRVTCRTCNGAGEVNTGACVPNHRRTCTDCNGAGKVFA